MTTARRDILKAGLAAAALTGIGASAEPLLGLMMPVADSPVPPEAKAMYPAGIRFKTESLGLAQMTPDGYDQVLDRIPPSAKRLKTSGATAITLMGTSLSFYKGAAFNRALTERMTKASGLPCTTMSTAVIEGLRKVGARRLAVPTAYNDEVNKRLVAFLHEEGFEVLANRGLGVVKVEDVNLVTQEALFKFCAEVFESAPKADAMLVSCGGLRTLDLLAPLEKRCGVPVVSSLPHALRAGVRLLGMSGRSPGYGRLLSMA